MARVAVAEHRLPAVVDQLADHEMELQVGPARRRGRCAGSRPLRRSSSSAGRAGGGATRRCPASDACERRASERPNRSFRCGASSTCDDVDVVVQVAADAGQVVLRPAMPCACRCARRADAREHQELRRLQRAGRTAAPRAGRETFAVAAVRRAPRRRSRGRRRRRCASSCAPVTTRRFGRPRFGVR